MLLSLLAWKVGTLVAVALVLSLSCLCSAEGATRRIEHLSAAEGYRQNPRALKEGPRMHVFEASLQVRDCRLFI